MVTFINKVLVDKEAVEEINSLLKGIKESYTGIGTVKSYDANNALTAKYLRYYVYSIYNDYACRYYIGYYKETKPSINKKEFKIALSNLTADNLEKLTTAYAYNKIKKLKTENTFDVNKPDLSLNDFSFALFDNALAGKTLSSAEAMRYLDIVPHTSIGNKGYEVYVKYCKLIYDKTKNKSKTFLEKIQDWKFPKDIFIIPDTSNMQTTTTKDIIVPRGITNKGLMLTTYFSIIPSELSSILVGKINKKLNKQSIIQRIDLLLMVNQHTYAPDTIGAKVKTHLLAELALADSKQVGRFKNMIKTLQSQTSITLKELDAI